MYSARSASMSGGLRLRSSSVTGSVQIRADRGELARELERAQARAQVLADLAAHVGRVRDQRIESLVLPEPLRGGLRTDLVDARDVVRAVTDQREVVDDLLGEHVELVLHAGAVEHRIGHRVDQRDLRRHELRHVLVARGDENTEILFRGAAGERADHVVGFDAALAQDRQAHALHGFEQRLDLRAQVVGHRRPVRLVLGEQLVAKGLAGRVEHHGDALGIVVLQELREHVEHAEHCAGRLAARVGERRQRVECAVQVRRSVDEDEVGARGHSITAAACRSSSSLLSWSSSWRRSRRRRHFGRGRRRSVGRIRPSRASSARSGSEAARAASRRRAPRRVDRAGPSGHNRPARAPRCTAIQ